MHNICYIESKYPGESKGGSGVFVAQRVILTAGHNLIYPGLGKAETIQVQGFTGSPVGHKASQKWEEDHVDFFSRHDNGYIFSPDGSRCTNPFDLELETLDLTGKIVTVAGFLNGQPWSNSGKVTDSGPTKLNYDIDTSPGISGGPIYYERNGKNLLLGIHTNNAGPNQERGSGVRVTPRIIQDIKEYATEYG